MADSDLVELPSYSAGVVNIAKSMGFSDSSLTSHGELISKSYRVSKSITYSPGQPATNDNKQDNNINSTYKTDDNDYSDLIIPKYDREALKQVYDISDSLRNCVETYAVNINCYGWKLRPEIELSKINDKRVYRENRKPVKPSKLIDIDADESKTTMFFTGFSLDMTWEYIKYLKTISAEIYGDAFLEFECSGVTSEIIGGKLLESDRIHLMKRDKYKTPVTQFIKNPLTLEYEERSRWKRFRKFVQNYYQFSNKVYFKEFGDPRVLNARDGKYVTDEQGKDITDREKALPYIDKLIASGVDFLEATEIYHYKITDPEVLDGYGVPRWISLYPILMGVRSADLLNFNLLKNKGVPDLIMICEGAKAGTMKQQIQDQIEQNKLLGNLGNILIVEGENVKGSAGLSANPNYISPSIRIQPLSDLLTKEGMFMSFADKGSERTYGVFRLPYKANTVNRATAEVSKATSEEQVFVPMRKQEDDIINTQILPRLKTRYFTYQSLSSQIENTELKAKIVTDFARTGGFMPRDVRTIGAELLKVDLEDINEPFMDKPLVLSSANSPVNPNGSFHSTGNAGNVPDQVQQPDLNVNAVDNPPAENFTGESTMKVIELEVNKDSEILNKIKFAVEKDNPGFVVKKLSLYLSDDEKEIA